MGRHDWYRNTEWDSEIEAAFVAKLKRARDKAQYLRVQACTLATKHPVVALRLLDQYFGFGEHFDHAQAHVDRATALFALGNVEGALDSYDAALAVEEKRPSMLTQAYLNLSFSVAILGIEDRYSQALNILTQNKSRPIFPVDHFRWHTACSLILAELGHTTEARMHATQALEAAMQEHSGFRYHPSVGIVGDAYESVRAKLAANVVRQDDSHPYAPE